MSIDQLAREGAILKGIVCYCDNGVGDFISGLTLHFEGQAPLALSVDRNSDELMWNILPEEALKPIAIEKIFPAMANAFGLSIAWCWEMRNHQGYFDAVQFQLVDSTLKCSMIFQFKVAASKIEIFKIIRETWVRNE